MASLIVSAAVDGEVWGSKGLPPVTTTVTATIATSVSIQPEDVAETLEQTAVRGEQQDHRGQRDRLQGDHEADQEQLKKHSSPTACAEQRRT